MILKRTIDQYAKCNPEAMSNMSKNAIYFAFNDMKQDLITMHNEIERLKRELNDSYGRIKHAS